MLLAEQGQRLQPVHAGQLVIEQHQIEVGVQCGQFKRARAICRVKHLDLLIKAFEDLTQALTHQGVIIDDKYFQHAWIVAPIATHIYNQSGTELKMTCTTSIN